MALPSPCAASLGVLNGVEKECTGRAADDADSAVNPNGRVRVRAMNWDDQGKAHDPRQLVLPMSESRHRTCGRGMRKPSLAHSERQFLLRVSANHTTADGRLLGWIGRRLLRTRNSNSGVTKRE